MSFANEAAHSRFLRFAAEFRPRRIEFEPITGGVRLDVADAIEFMSKYRSQTEDDWQHEMDETHFFCTVEGFRDLAQACGFAVEAPLRLPASNNRLRDLASEIGFDPGRDYAWIQLALNKA